MNRSAAKFFDRLKGWTALRRACRIGDSRYIRCIARALRGRVLYTDYDRSDEIILPEFDFWRSGTFLSLSCRVSILP